MLLAATRHIRDLAWVLPAARRACARIPWKKFWIRLAIAFGIAFFGLIIGATAVILPPAFPIVLVASPLPVLLWAAPELRSAPLKALRKAFYLVLFVQTSVPVYYAIIIPGVPLLMVRRIFILSLVLLFLISVSGSRNVRTYIVSVLEANRPVSVAIVAYFGMAFLSIFSSADPASTAAHLVDVFNGWYVPFFACLVVIRNSDDVRRLFLFISACSILVATLGMADFIEEKNIAIEILPKFIVSALMDRDPAFFQIISTAAMRARSSAPARFSTFPCPSVNLARWWLHSACISFWKAKNSGNVCMGSSSSAR